MTSHSAYDIPPEARSMDHGLAGNTLASPEHEKVARSPVPFYQNGFIGTSLIMQNLYEEISHAARSQAPVFITGETGAGKEVCAETIHQHSTRRDKPFIAINCAAIPRDLLESELFGHVKGAFTGAIADRDGAASLANGGTLFLDEVAEMAPDMQTKLLRFLQDFSFRKVGGSQTEKTNVRLICATNRNPLDEIARGALREDLYFRLHVIPLQIPPLRERGEDILDIAYALLRRYSQEEGRHIHAFTEDVKSVFLHYPWPGNVRQLQNVLRYICVMNDGEYVTSDMLPRKLLHRQPAKSPNGGTVPRPSMGGADPSLEMAQGLPAPLNSMTLEEIERLVIEQAVSQAEGNIPQAAARLGVAPSTIYRKRMLWAGDSREGSF